MSGRSRLSLPPKSSMTVVSSLRQLVGPRRRVEGDRRLYARIDALARGQALLVSISVPAQQQPVGRDRFSELLASGRAPPVDARADRPASRSIRWSQRIAFTTSSRTCRHPAMSPTTSVSRRLLASARPRVWRAAARSGLASDIADQDVWACIAKNDLPCNREISVRSRRRGGGCGARMRRCDLTEARLN